MLVIERMLKEGEVKFEAFNGQKNTQRETVWEDKSEELRMNSTCKCFDIQN